MGRTDVLFDLFQTREEFPVLNEDGEQVTTVTLRSLSWHQNNSLAKALETARFKVRAEMAKNNQRQQIEDSMVALNLEQLIDFVIGMERPTTTSVADLAPNGLSEDSLAAQKKEEEAVAKWEGARRAELGEQSLGEVRELVVRRQEALYVQARSVQDYVNESLCLMIIDPDTEQPLFEPEPFLPDGKTPNPKYLGRAHPELLNQFYKFRQDFLARRAEKPVRKAAEDPAFLLSGGSPKAEGDSPGGTTETPPTSRRLRSASTTAAAG